MVISKPFISVLVSLFLLFMSISILFPVSIDLAMLHIYPLMFERRHILLQLLLKTLNFPTDCTYHSSESDPVVSRSYTQLRSEFGKGCSKEIRSL